MCLESRAAGSSVINDLNGDGVITSDEVNIDDLLPYYFVNNFRFVSNDITRDVINSEEYSSVKEVILNSDDDILVGSIADGKFSLSETVQNVFFFTLASFLDTELSFFQFSNVYDKSKLLSMARSLNDKSILSDSGYASFYAYYESHSFEGAFGWIYPDGSFEFCYPSDAFCIDSYSGSPILNTFQFKDGCWQLYKYSGYQPYTCWVGTVSSNFMNPNSSGWIIPYSSSYAYFGIGKMFYIFDSLADFINYVEFNNKFYFDIYCISDDFSDVPISYINNNDWAKISSTVYSNCQSAVSSMNYATVTDVHNIISSELDSVLDSLDSSVGDDSGIGGDSGNDDDSGSGSGDNSLVLSEKLEEFNQLQQESNELQQENNELQKDENETSKGILGKLTDFFGSFFDNLINSVVGLFVPSTDELKALFDRLNQFFSDTFGFLYYPFDFLIQAFDIFLSSDSSTGLTFPGFSIMGYEVWADYTYDIASDPVAGSIFEYVRIGTGVILSMFFIGYLRAFFDKRFGGGGS